MPINVIQMGYRGIGRQWCKTIQASKACQFVGVVDIDADVRAEAASLVDGPIYSSISEARKAVDIAAVVIATPSFAHAGNVRDCLENGLHVLVEKPFTLGIDEAVKLVALADRVDRRLVVSQNYRFHGLMTTLRDLLQDGKIGQPGFFQIDGFNLADVEGASYRCRMDNPHMWEMAIHQFDLLRFLFSAEVERVFCTLSNPSWSWYQGNATTHAWLELDNGVKVNYTGPYATQGPQSSWDNGWRIEGTAGTLLIDDDPIDPLTFVAGPEGEVERLPLQEPEHEALAGTLDKLVQVIDAGAAAECSARDNLKTVAICSACEKSAHEGRFVALSEILP